MSIVAPAEEIVLATRHWLEKAVIGLDLCPFAKSVYTAERVRYYVSDARSADGLLEEFAVELRRLSETNPARCETTLIIHPYVLGDFLDYNDFLDDADIVIAALGYEGEFQIASFHPQYQFAGTAPDDIGNYTNRSPYPMLQILREASVERAIAAYPDADAIYLKNIETLRRLGIKGWTNLGIAAPKLPHK